MTALTSARDLRSALIQRQVAQGPTQFKGTLKNLFENFIEPNLPAPDVVADFHRHLVEYVRSEDPLFLLRMVRDTTRREEYRTADGTRFRATDNAPAWWTQYAMLQGHTIAAGHIGDVIESIPAHMFDVSKTIPAAANASGWHIAHIFNVKDGRIDYSEWSRTEVAARFLRNLHPCNYFLVPKADWQHWGGDGRVIGFFADLYKRRYADIWPEYVAMSGGRTIPTSAHAGSILIEISESDPAPKAAKPNRSVTAPRPTGDDRCVTYAATRLTFKARIIESLAHDQLFRVVTPVGTFELTKDDVYRDFPNVIRSASYREKGIYHWPTLPKAALKYRVADATSDSLLGGE